MNIVADITHTTARYRLDRLMFRTYTILSSLIDFGQAFQAQILAHAEMGEDAVNIVEKLEAFDLVYQKLLLTYNIMSGEIVMSVDNTPSKDIEIINYMLEKYLTQASRLICVELTSNATPKMLKEIGFKYHSGLRLDLPYTVHLN